MIVHSIPGTSQTLEEAILSEDASIIDKDNWDLGAMHVPLMWTLMWQVNQYITMQNRVKETFRSHALSLTIALMSKRPRIGLEA